MTIYAYYCTFGYLNQIRLNNPDHNLLQFSASDSSVIIEETESETVLKHPLEYDIIKSEGNLDENYFYSVIFIPTSEDHDYKLEKNLESVTTDFHKFTVYISYCLL